VIEVDPRIEQKFAEVLARSRQRAADITDRVAAVQRQIEERSKQIQEEGKRVSDDLDRRAADKRERARNPWQNRESKPTVLAFGGDDEEKRPAAPAQPAATPPRGMAHPVPPPTRAPQPPPEPAPPERNPRVLSFEVDDDEVAPRRPVRPANRARPSDDEPDDDYSGRSWMR
jgi:hypothetical protein